MQEKDFNKTEVKNIICINLFDYDNKLVFPFYVSYQKFVGFVDSMDLLLLIDDDKSRYVYIKGFDIHKTKNKNKKWFCRRCLQCFGSKSVLIKHKENFLSINKVNSQ